MARPKTIAVAKVGQKYRVNLTVEVAKLLGVEVNDYILIIDDGRGNIVIKKAE